MNCVYCHTDLNDQDALVKCASCNTRYHSECWDANSARCSVFGCEHTTAFVVNTDLQSEQPEINIAPVRWYESINWLTVLKSFVIDVGTEIQIILSPISRIFSHTSDSGTVQSEQPEITIENEFIYVPDAVVSDLHDADSIRNRLDDRSRLLGQMPSTRRRRSPRPSLNVSTQRQWAARNRQQAQRRRPTSAERNVTRIAQSNQRRRRNAN